MITRSQKVRLGIFISVSIFALIAAIIIIVAPKLFEVRDVYYIAYKDISVTGLQISSTVKYRGLSIGYVDDIYIDPENMQRVIVEVSLDHNTPIKEDTYANIEILGITGLKILELRGGRNESLSLKPGDYIKPGTSSTEMITGKAEILAEKAEIVLNNLSALTTPENRDMMLNLVTYTSNTMKELSSFLIKNRSSLNRIVANSEQLSQDLNQLINTTNQTMANLEVISGSDSLKEVIANLAAITGTLKEAQLIELVQELNKAIVQTNSVLKEVDITLAKSRSDFGYSVEALRESAEYLNQFARMLTEDPSILIRGTKPKNAPDFNLEK